MTFREDESRARDRRLAENLAWLRRFALGLLKQHPDGKTSLAMKWRKVLATPAASENQVRTARRRLDAISQGETRRGQRVSHFAFPGIASNLVLLNREEGESAGGDRLSGTPC